MNKKKLVIIEAPDRCRDCKFLQDGTHGYEFYYYCLINNERVKEFNTIPPKCPLVSLPKTFPPLREKDYVDDDGVIRSIDIFYDMGYVKGRNDCIEEMIEAYEK